MEWWNCSCSSLCLRVPFSFAVLIKLCNDSNTASVCIITTRTGSETRKRLGQTFVSKHLEQARETDLLYCTVVCAGTFLTMMMVIIIIICAGSCCTNCVSVCLSTVDSEHRTHSTASVYYWSLCAELLRKTSVPFTVRVQFRTGGDPVY